MVAQTDQDFVMIDDYLIDVTLSEGHEFESEITDYPVESGSNISDNIRLKPVMVTMEGLVSKTPFDHIAVSRTPAGSDDPPDDAYIVLRNVRDQREPVTIRTSLGTFLDMGLESLSIPKDPETGEALRFTAKFKQITTVTNKRGTRTAIPNGNTKKNFGQLLAKIKSLAAIPVKSFPQSQRSVWTGVFGPPILSTKETISFVKTTNGIITGGGGFSGSSELGTRKRDGFGLLDHYKIQSDAKLDGYVLQNVYYRTVFQTDTGGLLTEGTATSIRGTPVHWDDSKHAWVNNDGSRTTHIPPPGQGRWNGVTVYNPSNGTGKTF